MDNHSLRFKKADGTSYPDWGTSSLGEVCERVTRKNKGNISDNALTISAQYGLINQEEYFNKQIASKDNEHYILLHKGEFAYNKSYSTGYPFGVVKRLDKYDMGIASNLYIFFSIDNTKINSDFLVQYFNTTCWHDAINSIAQEGARNHGLLNVKIGDFFETKHRLPCLEEQEKIADFFTALDEKITLIDEQLSQLNLYKQAQLQSIFSPENTENWATMRLGDHITCKRGGSISKSDLSDQGQPCILYGELYTKYTEIIDKVYSKTLKNMNDSLSQKYDVIIPTSGETAEDIALATSCVLLDNIILGGDLMILRPDLNKINGVFLTYYIRSIYKIISPLGQGVSVVHLYWKNLSQLPLPLPSLEEQAKIADYLSALDDKITNTQQSLEQIKSYKLAMLQKMIT